MVINASFAGRVTAQKIFDSKNKVISKGKKCDRIELEKGDFKIALVRHKIYKKIPRSCFSCFSRAVYLKVKIEDEVGFVKVNKESLRKRLGVSSKTFKNWLKASSRRDLTDKVQHLIPHNAPAPIQPQPAPVQNVIPQIIQPQPQPVQNVVPQIVQPQPQPVQNVAPQAVQYVPLPLFPLQEMMAPRDLMRGFYYTVERAERHKQAEGVLRNLYQIGAEIINTGGSNIDGVKLNPELNPRELREIYEGLPKHKTKYENNLLQAALIIKVGLDALPHELILNAAKRLKENEGQMTFAPSHALEFPNGSKLGHDMALNYLCAYMDGHPNDFPNRIELDTWIEKKNPTIKLQTIEILRGNHALQVAAPEPEQPKVLPAQ